MPSTYPSYTPEFRQRIIELARTGRSINQLTRSLSRQPIRSANGSRQAALDEGLRNGGLSMAEREELNRLRRENRVLCEEREILAKPRPG
jgi:transposase